MQDYNDSHEDMKVAYEVEKTFWQVVTQIHEKKIGSRSSLWSEWTKTDGEGAESKCTRSGNSSVGIVGSIEEKGRENFAETVGGIFGIEFWGGNIREELEVEDMIGLEVQCLKGKMNSLKMTSLDKKTVLEAKSYNL